MKPWPDSRVGRFLASRWGADAVLWVTVCASVVFLDNAQPLRFGLSPVAADVLAVGRADRSGGGLASAPRGRSRRAERPQLRPQPGPFYENLLFALVLAFLLGRHTRRTRTGLLLWVGICVTALLVAAVAPARRG